MPPEAKVHLDPAGGSGQPKATPKAILAEGQTKEAIARVHFVGWVMVLLTGAWIVGVMLGKSDVKEALPLVGTGIGFLLGNRTAREEK
jgi:hypothetical protein